MKSQYKVLASNTAIFAIGTILVKLISFFLMPIYTSALSTSDYGIAEMLNNSIEIVMPLATLCIIEALFRFSMDNSGRCDSLYSNSLIIVIIGDIVVAGLCVLWHALFQYPYTFHFFLLYFTSTIYKLNLQFARGLGHIKRYVVCGVMNSLLLVASNVLLLLKLNGGIQAYLYSFSIGYGIVAVVAFFISKEYKYFKIESFDTTVLKSMLKYSLPSIPNLLSWWVNSLSDRYIIMWICSPAIAGLYTAASKLPAMVNMVTAVFQQAWQYSTAKEVNTEGSSSFFSNVFRVYVYFCCIVCSTLLVFNKVLCHILLQADFFAAWKYVPLLLLAATFGCVGTYYGTFYNAVKNNKMLMVSTIIGAVFNIICNIILIPILGGIGAAIATVISYFIIMLIRIVDVRKFIELRVNYRTVSVQFVLLIISAIVSCMEYRVTSMISLMCMVLIILTEYKTLIICSKRMMQKLKKE